MKKFFKHTGILAIIFIMLIGMCITGCSRQPSPDVSVKEFFDALKKNDIGNATKYLSDGDDITNSIYTFNQKEKELTANLLSKLDYKITNVAKNKDQAVVRVEITAPNFLRLSGRAFDEVMPQVMDLISSGDAEVENKSYQLIEDFFIKSLNDPDMPISTDEYDFVLNYNKENKIWLIDDNDTIINAVSGNIMQTISKFEKSAQEYWQEIAGDTGDNSTNEEEEEGEE